MGFNQSSNDLWLGNEHVFYLTHQGNYTLRVEAEGWTGKKYWAQYGTFYIDDEADGYELHVGNYSGIDQLCKPRVLSLYPLKIGQTY